MDKASYRLECLRFAVQVCIAANTPDADSVVKAAGAFDKFILVEIQK